MRHAFAISSLAGLLVLAGCDKTYTLRFQAVSIPEDVRISYQYDRHANITEDVGVLRPAGETKGKLTVDPEMELPGTVTWYARTVTGEPVVSGQFMVDKQTDSKILVRVDQAAGGRSSARAADSFDSNTTGTRTTRSRQENGYEVREDNTQSTTESEPEMIVVPD